MLVGAHLLAFTSSLLGFTPSTLEFTCFYLVYLALLTRVVKRRALGRVLVGVRRPPQPRVDAFFFFTASGIRINELMRIIDE